MVTCTLTDASFPLSFPYPVALPPSIVDWGNDLSMGKKFLPSGQWWMITFPGAMISLLAVGFTMLGEGLAEILNPRLLER